MYFFLVVIEFHYKYEGGIDKSMLTNTIQIRTLIGPKLKYFRNKAGFSQSQVEVALDITFGALSRIESGKTSPTKETIFRLARFLKLNKLELDYLVGTTQEPVSQEEIAQAIEEVLDYFNTDGVLAYLLDERNRLIHVSKDFLKLLTPSETTLKKAIGMPIPVIYLDPTFKVYDLINTSELENVLYHNLSKYYYDTHFMIGDEYFNMSLAAIKSNSIALKIWRKIMKNPPKFINTMKSRKVTFNIGGAEVIIVWSAEALYTNYRFTVLDFMPVNPVNEFSL